MSLLELQYAFKETLWNENDSLFLAKVRQTKLSPADHFAIYRNNILSSLTDILKIIYPKVTSLIGCEAMQAASRLYIKRALPEIAHLNSWPQNFPNFLVSLDAFKALFYLKDVARLEWLSYLSLNAFDQKALGVEAFFQQLKRFEKEEKDFRIMLHPSCFLLKAGTLLELILRIATGEDEMYEIQKKSAFYLIFRCENEGQAKLKKLLEEEFYFIEALLKGKSFANAFELAYLKNNDFNLQRLFSFLGGRELICSLDSLD